MPRTVLVSGDAARDIESIHSYIAAHTSAVAADKILAALEDRIMQLATLADRGNFPKELAATGSKEFRELHFKPYRIVYRVEGNNVVVYCIADGRRDMSLLLRRRLLE
ncbi:MAG TPA: type II toxin-antitoxin system RelE/ParE family toxin [Rhizomicrobium sp.]|nr:type II toxin-antitoxin system RelE/ParE family toxin [Rhizomicrobium sp.]